MAKPTKSIKEEVLKVLNEDKNTQLRVVAWNYGRPRLEKRNFFMAEGKRGMGKATGLDADDMRIVLAHLDEIKSLLGV